MDRIALASTQAGNQNEQYFLRAGQKYDENTNPKIRPIFEDVDLNHDKEISQNEIDAYKQYLTLKEINDKKREEFMSTKSIANLPLKLGIASGAAGGMAGAVGSHLILKKIGGKALFKEIIVDHYAPDNSKHYFEGDFMYSAVEYISTPLKKALTYGGAIVAAGLIGYGIYKLISKFSQVSEAKKEVAKRKVEMEQENMQVEKLDIQYKNINAAVEKAKKLGNNNLSSEEAMKVLFLNNMLLMMADDEEKRRQQYEKDNEDYFKANIERSINKPYEN